MKKLEIGAAYIRVSTDDQTELSPDAQLRVILDAAKADGITIPPEFIFIEKKGISGRRAENRPEFQRMIAIAKAQSPPPFRRLYLWKFSRFARNQEESTFYKGILRKKCGIEIKSVSEPIAEGMFGRLIETIIEWFDEYYSINLSGEVLRGMTEKALREGYQTTPCLGYDAVGGGKPFVINENDYSIVEFIFHSYHEGRDINYIARTLNASGYKTRRGSQFDNRSINRILRNRFYVGEVTWNGITFQGSHETRDSITTIFDEVQSRLDSMHKPHRRREVSANRHWLSGLLTCSVCGATLGFNRTRDSKKRPDFFQCWKYSKGMHAGSCGVSVNIAEKAVLKSLQTIIQTQEVHYEYIPRTEGHEDAEEAMLLEALERLKVKERRIKEAYENEIDTLEEYRQNKLRLQAEREELEAEAERIRRSAINRRRSVPGKDVMLDRITEVYRLISDPDIPFDKKGNALRSVVEKIVFDRETRSFSFFYYLS